MADTRPVAMTGERIGKNEALFREVNERIKEVSAANFGFGPADLCEFVCECSLEECHEPVPMTRLEYEDVRVNGAHFLIAPGHVRSPELERAVAEYERYWVVEKQAGARRVAVNENPRT
jgi:hypothetical protein